VNKCVIEYAVQAIILGDSRDYKGVPNKIMKDVLSFKKELEGLTRLPVYLEPEFMTSMQAERLDRELGGKSSSGKENKNSKDNMLDATAAAFILLSFLDKHSNEHSDEHSDEHSNKHLDKNKPA
jgi:RNase H-fold protein (predicted Holliday junction resolvase)